MQKKIKFYCRILQLLDDDNLYGRQSVDDLEIALHEVLLDSKVMVSIREVVERAIKKNDNIDENLAIQYLINNLYDYNNIELLEDLLTKKGKIVSFLLNEPSIISKLQ